MINFKKIIIREMGLDYSRLIYFFVRLPWFLRDFFRFKQINKEHYSSRSEVHLNPCLHDKHQEAGDAYKNEYFWQDLFVAKLIRKTEPLSLLDIGSRIDGFVSHVLSFRDITIMDVRRLDVTIDGLSFIQGDIAVEPQDFLSSKKYDCVTCLHAFEHFGLGRYGDKVSSLPHTNAAKNITSLLSDNGVLYLSVPLANKSRIEFNANMVFAIEDVLEFFQSLKLVEIYLLSESGFEKHSLGNAYKKISNCSYKLGVFVFSS